MSRLVLVCALLLVASPPAVSAAPEAPPGPEVLWEGRAWQVEVVDGVAVALDADLLHVTGVDVTTGKRRWRRQVQKKANGYHTLQVIGGRLFFWAGPTLMELSPKTGKVLRSGEVVHNRATCQLDVRGTLGAATCEVGLWLFALDPIKLGPYFPASEIHIYEDLSQPHSTHFLRSARTLLGRAGDLAVVAVEDKEAGHQSFFRASAMLAGVDPRSGEVRWKTSELVKDGLTWAGVRDGTVAWVVSESTRAAGAVDARTGALLWKVAAEGEETPFNGDLTGDGDAVVVLVDDVVRCRDLRTGKERWHAAAEGASRVVALGGREEPLVYGGEKPGKIALATVDGKLVLVDLPPYGSAARDGDTLVLPGAGRVRRYDVHGRLLADVEGPAGGTFHVTPAAIGGFTAGQAVVFGREGAPIAGLPEDAYLSGGAGDVIIVMTRAKERDQPGTARLVRVRPAPQGTRR
ncbi:MAG: hypothetical protein EP329_10470 [Deltaproteobacteria bacterium]|nr:MAG: hypothetical protein EP329_10470 [Deltaproteobacteria bacterium]